MKNLGKLIISIIGCELVGIIGTIFTVQAIPTWYTSLNKPSFSPPNWLFGPVWTLLYFLMGISFFLIWRMNPKPQVTRAKKIFFVQLALNFIWTPIFFGLRSPLLGLITILLMLFFILLTLKNFYSLSKPAFYLLIPYLVWVSFATILNAAIVSIN
jgi:tryptophan-rich sensory protein